VTTDLVTFERNVIADPRTTAPARRPAGPPTPPDRLLHGRTAAQVMERFPVVVDQHTSLFSAWGKLRRTGARHLVVIDDDLRPTGVLDERDMALEWPPGPLAAQHLPVHQLLRFRTRPRLRSGEDIATVAATMRSARVDAVPVVDRDGRLLGLVTAQHCVELIAQAPTVTGAGGQLV